MKKITLYTDGACSGNPGVGGWGSILIFENKEKELSGGELLTTNNKMELMAVISGLKALKEPCEVDIYSDSAYVVNAFLNNWIENWKKNGWKTSNKTDVQNKDFWLELIALTHTHKIIWHKVKGHADNELNNRCDKLARNEVEKILKNI